MRFNTLNSIRRFAVILGIGSASFIAAHSARAFTYSDEDLLLVFREDGYNDVEYNLGNVNWLLNLPAGSTVVITNWDPSLLSANYGSDLMAGVKVALLGSAGVSATNLVSWITSSSSNNSGQNLSPAGWRLLWSKISGVGNNALAYTAGSQTESVAISPAQHDSYTYLASNTGIQPALIPTLGGASPFPIEGDVPADLQFIQIASSGAAVKPAAPVVGVFHINTSGQLSFTAAGGTPPLAPATITSVSRASGAVSITFTTAAGVNYRLRSSPQVGVGAVWSVTGQGVAGTGLPATLTDTPVGTTRFYLIETYQ